MRLERAVRQGCWRILDLKGGALCLAFSSNEQTLALGVADGSVRLVEAATGKERTRFQGHPGHVWSVAFSPCGLSLVSAGANMGNPEVPDICVVWDVTGVIRAGRNALAPMTPAELDAQWNSLGRVDAAKAWQAICALAARPAQAVPLLKARVTEYRASKAEAARLVANLDSDDFRTRETASRRLGELGAVALPYLRAFSAAAPSIEAKRRALGLLAQISDAGLVSEEMRNARA